MELQWSRNGEMGGRWKFWVVPKGMNRHFFQSLRSWKRYQAKDLQSMAEMTGMDEVGLEHIRSWIGIPSLCATWESDHSTTATT